MSEEALQIAEEKREVKGRGERERYTQLNVEFQRTTRRDKKALLNEQCKEIEEDNRKTKTSDHFKKIGDIEEHLLQGWDEIVRTSEKQKRLRCAKNT